jgi:hypothetical protein
MPPATVIALTACVVAFTVSFAMVLVVWIRRRRHTSAAAWSMTFTYTGPSESGDDRPHRDDPPPMA